MGAMRHLLFSLVLAALAWPASSLAQQAAEPPAEVKPAEPEKKPDAFRYFFGKKEEEQEKRKDDKDSKDGRDKDRKDGEAGEAKDAPAPVVAPSPPRHQRRPSLSL